MSLIHTLTILICLAALFSYVNHRLLKLPITIGLMAVALVFSLVPLVLGKLGLGVEAGTQRFVAYRMLRSVDNYQVEILITLALVMGSFGLADLLHTSGPIAVVVAARWLSVVLHVKLFSLVRTFSARTITILTWGGLRGGISVALALSLSVGPMRDAVVTITYAVVVFSILVQGLTINRVLGMGNDQTAA